MHPRSFFWRRDLSILLFILVVALICSFAAQYFMENDTGNYAEILLDGQVVGRLALEENQTYVVPNRTSVRLEVRDGGCGFVHSDCPDKICIHTGFLSITGQTASCLPNRVTMHIIGDKEKATLDAVVG